MRAIINSIDDYGYDNIRSSHQPLLIEAAVTSAVKRKKANDKASSKSTKKQIREVSTEQITDEIIALQNIEYGAKYLPPPALTTYTLSYDVLL